MIGAVLLGFIIGYSVRVILNRRIPIWIGVIFLFFAYILSFITLIILTNPIAGASMASESMYAAFLSMSATYTVCMKDETFSKAKDKKLVFWAILAYIIVFLSANLITQYLKY